jgi:hypothetical protein
MTLFDLEVKRLVHDFSVGWAKKMVELEDEQLKTFGGYLKDFLEDLLNYPLARPWRESLDLFQEHYWQQVGMRLAGESYNQCAARIEQAINDPRCPAHGPIRPESALAPARRLPEWVTGPAKPRPPGGVPPEQDLDLRRLAGLVAKQEQKRIGLTDEETALYEANRYENFRRQYVGDRPLGEPEFWHAKNAAVTRRQRGNAPLPAVQQTVEPTRTAETNQPETPRSHVVSVAPNVSGPAESGNKSAGPQSVFINGVEVAGPGPETTQSYRDKVQKSLETLDPRVARWWKAPSVEGQVRSRSAALALFKYTSYLGANDQPFIVVNENLDAGQTAQAIIAEAQGGLLATSIGAFYKKYKFSQSGDWKEFRQWQQRSVGEAARLASVLAELYINSIATLTPAGDLVVTIGDVAERGPQWDQLISILPLLSYLPIGAIIIKLGNRDLKLSKKLVQKFEKLTETERKSILVAAAGAKTDDEAAAIIKREVALIVGDRQIHHAISETVYEALQKHKNLKGKYHLRDKRFESLAFDYEAHHGWEVWHRKLDEEVAAWVEDHKDATEAAFEAWLRWRYAQPDLKARFPKGF